MQYPYTKLSLAKRSRRKIGYKNFINHAKNTKNIQIKYQIKG